MTEEQLRSDFEEARASILRERRMRASVFPPGHPDREKRVGEMDRLLDILVRWKDALKEHVEPTYQQPALIDVPARTKYE